MTGAVEGDRACGERCAWRVVIVGALRYVTAGVLTGTIPAALPNRRLWISICQVVGGVMGDFCLLVLDHETLTLGTDP